MQRVFKLGLLTLTLLMGPVVMAAEETVVNTSVSDPTTRFDWGRAFEKLDATYAGLMEGPTLDHLDGNKDGKGTFIQIKHYLYGDYEVAPYWRVEAGSEFRQYFRPDDPKKPGRSNFESRDPYVGIARRDLVKGDLFSLVARARYYIPVSENTKGRVGKAFDTGNGTLNFFSSAAWKFGKFSFTCPLEVWVNLAKAPIAEREQYTVKFKTQFAYKLDQQWAAKAEYSTGDMRHTANGHWSKLNDRELGHKVVAGATYAPVKEVLVNPALTWGKAHWQLNRPEISLYASYNFL